MSRVSGNSFYNDLHPTGWTDLLPIFHVQFTGSSGPATTGALGPFRADHYGSTI